MVRYEDDLEGIDIPENPFEVVEVRAVGDHQRGARTAHDMGEHLAPIRGIDRDLDRTDLRQRQPAEYVPLGVVEQQEHRVARRHAEISQAHSEPVSDAVDLPTGVRAGRGPQKYLIR